MEWIAGIALVAAVGLWLAFKKWNSSADDFWDDIQARADVRDQETAERKAAEREAKKRKALERAAAAKADKENATVTAAESTPTAEPAAPGTFRELDAAGAQALLAERSDTTILDVRTPGETMAGIIEGAMTIPMDLLQTRLDELPQDGPLLVYCAVGGRSAAVCDVLARAGRTEVYNLDGGITGWTGKVVRPA